MTDKIEVLVAEALTNVKNPRVEKDVISAGMVRSMAVSDGVVSFDFLLSREDSPKLVRDVRKAVKAVEGVRDVQITVGEPATEKPTSQQAGTPPAPKPQSMPHLGTVIAISSGKGGVGKSTVSSNIATALAAGGARVGILDGDVYGPNIPRMFGREEQPEISDNRIIPLEAHGVKLMSLGFMMERDTPAIWRGPIIQKIIQQFLNDVEWGKLDYLLVDLPPGTGDAQLALVQTVKVDAAVIVTTPQQMSTGDALRGAKMFEKVGVPVIGIVENMAGFACPHCDEITNIFESGGAQALADEIKVPLIGQIPLQAGMASMADHGEPIVVARPDSPAAIALVAIAREIRSKVGGKTIPLPVVN